jgi:ribonuclease HII
MNNGRALKALVDDARIGTLGAAEIAMQLIEQPRQKVDRIIELADAKALVARERNRLQHFVRRSVRFEAARIPALANKLAKALNQQSTTKMSSITNSLEKSE